MPIIFDLDSTLADTSPRHHLSPFVNPAKTWEDYSAACHMDKPMEGVIALAKALWHTDTIFIVTGRRDTARAQTENWLRYYGVPYDKLIMRSAEDDPSNIGFKKGIIQSLLSDSVTISLFINDWPAECHMAKELGIPYVLINPEYVDNTMVGWDNVTRGD